MVPKSAFSSRTVNKKMFKVHHQSNHHHHEVEEEDKDHKDKAHFAKVKQSTKPQKQKQMKTMATI